MKKTTNTLNLMIVFVIASLFFSCTKTKEEFHSSAQNIYPISNYSFEGIDWFLANDELAVYNPDRSYSISPLNKMHRIGLDFKNKHFTNYLVDTFSPFWYGNEKRYVFQSKILKLDDTHFLLVNSFYREGVSSNDWYTKVYLTDSHLKNKTLIADRDSSYRVNYAGILPDKRIILLETKYSNYRTKISCVNLNNKIDWANSPNAGFIGLSFNNDLVIANSSIYVLQKRYENNLASGFGNVIFSYDFSGKLIQLKKMLTYEKTHEFNYLTALGEGLVLTGLKYNESSRLYDLVLLKMNTNLNPIIEKSMSLADVAPDYSFIKNAYLNDYDFENSIPRSAVFANSIWITLPYFSKQAGSSLKLIKMNQSLEVESVKSIISHIPERISSVAVRANDSYIFIGGANYKGCFFYRMDIMGNFN